jgi:hypothetical protein
VGPPACPACVSCACFQLQSHGQPPPALLVAAFAELEVSAPVNLLVESPLPLPRPRRPLHSAQQPLWRRAASCYFSNPPSKYSKMPGIKSTDKVDKKWFSSCALHGFLLHKYETGEVEVDLRYMKTSNLSAEEVSKKFVLWKL